MKLESQQLWTTGRIASLRLSTSVRAAADGGRERAGFGPVIEFIFDAVESSPGESTADERIAAHGAADEIK